MFELELYSTEDGKEPVAEFLDSLDRKMNAKLIGLMELLEKKAPSSENHTQLLWRTEYLNFAASLEVTLRGRCTSSMSGNVLW